MKVEIACSTMFGQKPEFILNDNLNDFIIINQCKSANHENPDFLNFYEVGLSRSRNRALYNSDADIIIISDNDVRYVDNVYDVVRNSFLEHPDLDIITFMFKTPEGHFSKKYKNHFFLHNFFTIGKVYSIEIAIKLKKIKEMGVSFNEEFGLGSKYETGEEYIFLHDALKRGLKIGFVPQIIAMHPEESSGSNFKNHDLIIAKGALFRKTFGVLGIFICLIFALKKYKLTELTLINFLKLMISGFKR